MRKLIFTLLLTLVTITMSAQFQRSMNFNRGFSNIETLSLEQVATPFPTENNDYLMELPRKGRMVIAYNSDKTKAKVLFNGTPMDNHKRYINRIMEFDVKENEVRLILYHMDNNIFCGYIYDKAAKACKYFEAIDEEQKDKLVDKVPFIQRIPSFSAKNDKNSK